MNVTKITRNAHTIFLTKDEYRIALLSDIHFDNPKCDREKLKEHLDFCKEQNIPIFINGDFFCLMQGKYDPRRSKKDIRPEHNVANYIDAVIQEAVDWWSPYADLLTVIGYGNHETAIIKNLETDPLQRFVDMLNYTCKSNVFTGGYGGWILIKKEVCKNTIISKSMKYFHGSAGGGIVTRGAINLTRSLEIYEGMDIFTMGHIHENSSRNDVRDTFEYNAGKHTYQQKQKQIHLCITGSYKEEYEDGSFGWHVERGAPVKPVGGRILNIYTRRVVDNIECVIDSSKFHI